jgi:hypothetical protein
MLTYASTTVDIHTCINSLTWRNRDCNCWIAPITHTGLHDTPASSFRSTGSNDNGLVLCMHIQIARSSRMSPRRLTEHMLHRSLATAVCCVWMLMALLRSSAVVHATCSRRIPVRQYTRRVSAWRASYPVVDQVPCIMSSPAAQPAMQPAASAVPWQQCWIQQDMSRACEVVLPDSIRVQSRVLLPVLAANLVPMPQGLPHLSRLTTAVKVQLMQLLVTAAQHPEQTEQLLAAALDAIMGHAQSSCQKVRLTETSPSDAFTAQP